MNWFSALIQAVTAYYRWLAIEQEAKTKHYLIIKQEEIEDENRDLEKSVSDMRRLGNHGEADRLLKRRTRRTLLLSGLFETEQGSDLHSDE